MNRHASPSSRVADGTPLLVDWRFGQPTIMWCDFGSLAFTDPFFVDTFQRLRRTYPDSLTWETDLQHLLDQSAQREGLTPAGFIFHTGRCGSTLVSRLLASSDRVLCLSEPDALFGMFDSPDSTTADQRRALLRALIMVLGRPRRRSETCYVVKFTSFHFLHLDLIAEVFPQTPWVFVFREPNEVMRSILARPTGFLRMQQTPSKVAPYLQTSAATVDSMQPEELVARFLARMYDLALEHVGAVQTGRAQFVDYQSLPTAIWTHVSPFFGFVPTTAEEARMQKQSRFNSKDRTSQTLFAPTTDVSLSGTRQGLAAERHLLTERYRKLQTVAQSSTRGQDDG